MKVKCEFESRIPVEKLEENIQAREINENKQKPKMRRIMLECDGESGEGGELLFAEIVEEELEEKLKARFYLIRFGEHELFSAPRRIPQEVISIIKQNPNKDIYLRTAEFPFLKMYKLEGT